MATVTSFYCILEDMAEGKHNLASDELKVMLTNTVPSLTDTVYGDITQIAAGNGYVSGGVVATVDSSSQTSGIYTLILSGVNFTASGGDIAANRCAVLYNNTAAAKNLLAYIDLSVSSIIPDGTTLPLNGTWFG